MMALPALEAGGHAETAQATNVCFEKAVRSAALRSLMKVR